MIEGEFNASPFDGDDPTGIAMLDEATAALDAMLLCGVWTAPAFLAKLEACGDGGGRAGSVIGNELRPEISVFQVIK